jgi:hypothetical protein
VLGFEWVNNAQAQQIRQTHLQRHGAAIGLAAVAHPGAVARPGIGAVNVDNVDRGSHGGI